MKTKDKVIFKVAIIYFATIVFFVVCIIKALNVQYFEESKIHKGQTYRRLKDTAIPERNIIRRGNILSCNGDPLSVYVPVYAVNMDFMIGWLHQKDTNKVNARIKDLSKQLEDFGKEKSAAKFEADIRKHREAARKAKEEGRLSYVKKILNNNLDIYERDRFREIPFIKGSKFMTGLMTEEKGVRKYPYGDMARYTIGFTWGDGENEKDMSGLERSFNKYLRNESEQADVITTLDTRVQDIATQALAKYLRADDLEAGTVVVMEVKTGEIKAMVNLKKQAGKIVETANYAIRNASDPGSTFKIAALTAALETGKVDITDLIDCDEGTKVKDGVSEWNRITDDGEQKRGKMTVQRIIELSKNIGTAKFVQKAFAKNEKGFLEMMDKIHAAEYFDILNEEVRPQIKHPEWNRNSMLRNATGYEMKISPLNTVCFFNAIANDGKMMKPMLVRKVRYADGSEAVFEHTVIAKEICSKNTLTKVRKVMSGVVNNGTGKNRLSNTPYGIAGKTGTAQILFSKDKKLVYYYVENGVKRKKHQASFCGYFPENNPEYTCIAMLYSKEISENVFGGDRAAPVFREIADKLYALSPNQRTVTVVPNAVKEIPPLKPMTGKSFDRIAKVMEIPYSGKIDKWVSVVAVGKKAEIKTLRTENGIMPDITGMGLRDAMFLLENMGQKVSFTGAGTVVSQSPAAGEKIKFGGKTVLTLKKGNIQNTDKT